jgi:hypothetical protein
MMGMNKALYRAVRTYVFMNMDSETNVRGVFRDFKVARNMAIGIHQAPIKAIVSMKVEWTEESINNLKKESSASPEDTTTELMQGASDE